MVHGINSAKSVQQKQAEHPIKKQESGPQKQNSIFNHAGSTAIEGAISGFAAGSVSVPFFNNGILEGTVEYQVNSEVVGQMTGNIAVDFGGIGEAALEGGIKGAVEGEKEE